MASSVRTVASIRKLKRIATYLQIIRVCSNMHWKDRIFLAVDKMANGSNWPGRRHSAVKKYVFVSFHLSKVTQSNVRQCITTIFRLRQNCSCLPHILPFLKKFTLCPNNEPCRPKVRHFFCCADQSFPAKAKVKEPPCITTYSNGRYRHNVHRITLLWQIFHEFWFHGKINGQLFNGNPQIS